MCGITGALGFSDPGLLNRMKSSLKHRGPDQEGTFFDENVMLGHRRLSILDLSEKGRQPMSNAEGTIHVVFNGEIYNFKDLRIQLEKKGYRFSTESDTEVLVHGYDAWGPSLCERLDGDFAFALWDSEKKQLVLSRDPVGVVPLYYTLFDGALFFASEIKAFFENPNVPRRVSAQGLSDYLCFRYPVGPLTLFERIFKVQPGQTLLARMEKGDVVLEKKRYFNLTFKEEPFTSSEAVQTLRQLVAQSVEKRLQSDVPLGVYLSGGLDSSYITALASRSGPVNTFSVRFGDDDDGSDLVHELVSRFNTNHTDLSVESDQFRLLGKIAWHLDEPPADIAALPTYLMAQVTKKHATVVLTGDGGDEVFGGYPRYRMLYRLKKGRSLIRGASSLILPLISSSLRERLSSAMHSKNDWELMTAYLAAFSNEERKGLLAQPLPEPSFLPQTFESLSFLNKQYAWDFQTLLPDDYLMKVNKANLAHGVEARVPFLDKTLVAFSARLPTHLKTDLFSTRIIQRKAMKGLVPDRILRQKKKGFNVPTARWMKQGLKELSGPLFESLARRSYFKNGPISDFLKRYGRHEAFDGRQFWTLLGFEIWHQTFIDPTNPRAITL